MENNNNSISLSDGAKKWLKNMAILNDNVVQGQEYMSLSEKWQLANQDLGFNYFEDCGYLYELQDSELIEILEFDNGFGRRT